MISLRQWFSQAITDADENSMIQIRDIPKQFPIRKANIFIWGMYTIAAGGAADYIIGSYSLPRLISNILFRTGGANIIKDISGLESIQQTVTWFPTDLPYNFPAVGTTFGVGTVIPFSFTLSVCFSDYDMPAPKRDETILIPSRYEDTLLQISFSNLEDICASGDRPYTMAGNVSVMIEQEQNLQITPNDVLREWHETKNVSSTGIMEIDLPKTELISRINTWQLIDGAPGFLSGALPGDVEINLNDGQTILYEGSGSQFGIINVQDMSMMTIIEFSNGLIPFNFNLNHDGVGVLDNRDLAKWTLKLPTTAPVPPVVHEVRNHYIGRVQVG